MRVSVSAIHQYQAPCPTCSPLVTSPGGDNPAEAAVSIRHATLDANIALVNIACALSILAADDRPRNNQIFDTDQYDTASK